MAIHDARPNETQDQCRVRERTRGCKLDKLDHANRPVPFYPTRRNRWRLVMARILCHGIR